MTRFTLAAIAMFALSGTASAASFDLPAAWHNGVHTVSFEDGSDIPVSRAVPASGTFGQTMQTIDLGSDNEPTLPAFVVKEHGAH